MKVRVKFHQMPGDISKKAKIAMMEKKQPRKRGAKGWLKTLRSRERAVSKERVRKVIDQ